ncbi:lytic transglycosylase domain-containing protein [Novosphingobium sp. NBM11]|uniref:lytic transglycosylase domain-containing protein n=1 Tax=Novosphingobium sp. NBM11 TaxID=2596914 RepID=UPI0035C8EFF2
MPAGIRSECRPGSNRNGGRHDLGIRTRYLRQQLDRFGAYHLALAAYNAGPGRVRNGSVPRIVETQDYVSNVLLNWSRLSGISRVATIHTSASPAPRREPFVRAATVSSF